MEFECLESPCAVTIQHEGANYKFWGENSWLILRQLRALKTFYELEMLEFLRQSIPNPDTVIDAGACIGNHSVFFDRVMNAKVIAAEPNDAAFDAFGANCAGGQGPNVTAIKAGLGESAHTRHLDFTPCFAAGNANALGYNIGGVQLTPERKYAHTPEIQVISIDGIMERATGKIDLIKIDVEGMELDVLRGAEQTIVTHRPWITVEVKESANLPQFDAFLKGYTRHPKVFNHTPTYVYKPAEIGV